MVEREVISLVKDFNSNTSAWDCDVAGLDTEFDMAVSGCNMVLSNELEPYACLKKVLDGERYRKVEERLCS